MKKRKPLVVGLTGPIGSGKTTVARIFREAFGIPVYHADDRAKQLMETQPELRRKIKETFGKDSYDENGRLNRAYLGQKVFADAKALKRLEKMVHPVVRADFKKWLQTQDAPYVLLENAILIKSGMDRFCDKIIWVNTDENIRTERIRKRNPEWDDAHIRQRMHSGVQNPENTDIPIIRLENSQNIKYLTEKIKEIHQSILDY